MTCPKTPVHNGDRMYTKTLHCALNILSFRNHTRQELKQKLIQKGFPEDSVKTVLSDCERWNYINDDRTASGYIESLVHKGFGIHRIRNTMRQRGFSKELIHRSISEHDLATREIDIARELLKKQHRRINRLKTEKNGAAKIIRFLIGKGFSNSVISTLIKEESLWEEGF